MRKGFGDRFLFVAFICVAMFLLLLLPGCSVQNPGTKVETIEADKSATPGGETRQHTVLLNQRPLRVNYLTPLCDIRNPEVFVYKEKRRLYIVETDVLVRDYPIGLGFQPKGDKEIRGDGKTPEGEFFICMKNPNSKFNRSLGLNYPSRRHAEKAFFADLISPIQFRDIIMSVDRMGPPPWDTALGGEIFIHGGGAYADWTEGCIALYDSDMHELFSVARVGTPVTVIP